MLKQGKAQNSLHMFVRVWTCFAHLGILGFVGFTERRSSSSSFLFVLSNQSLSEQNLRLKPTSTIVTSSSLHGLFSEVVLRWWFHSFNFRVLKFYVLLSYSDFDVLVSVCYLRCMKRKENYTFVGDGGGWRWRRSGWPDGGIRVMLWTLASWYLYFAF